jgi:hypothetical protein
MDYTVRVLTVSMALLLLGCGIWANLTNGSLTEMRGVWVSHAMRGAAS